MRTLKRPFSLKRRSGEALAVTSVSTALILWQLGGSDLSALPSFTTVINHLWELRWNLFAETGETLFAALFGLVLATAVGISLGFAIPLFPWARNTLDPLLDAAYATPVTLLIPVIAVYTGFDLAGRVFVVFTFVAVLMIVNTETGVRSVDLNLLETGRAFGLSRWSLWRQVIFPSALAYILTGFSQAVVRSIRGAVTAELLLAAAGLGGLIQRAGSLFRFADLYAIVLWTMCLGYIAFALARGLERRLLRWRDFSPARP